MDRITQERFAAMDRQIAALAVSEGFRNAARAAQPDRADVILSAWTSLTTEEMTLIGEHVRSIYRNEAKEAGA